MRFPYPPRRHQEEILAAMDKALDGGHLVLQSGTGSGKTICALYAALRRALEEDRLVLHLVRTNSQQRQVMAELRQLGPYGLALQGRQRMCLLAREDPELAAGTPEELSQFCSDRREEVNRGEPGCPHYRGLLDAELETTAAWFQEHLPTAEETVDRCESLGVCPYELNKLLAPRAKVVTAPYVYFFSAPLRRALLETLQRPLEDLIVIVDEAHNLPAYCREVASFQVSLRSLERAETEVMDYGDPELREGVSAFDLVAALQEAVRELTREYVRDEDGFLPPSALEAALMHAFTATSTQLRGMLGGLVALGEVVREARRRRGRLPRSYLLAVASSLLRWTALEEVEYAKLVVGGENAAVRAYCLDAAAAAHPLLECHATLHMSGTLQPLREYRDSLGLPEETALRAFPSPFPRENRRVVYVDRVTTRYEDLSQDPEAMERLREEVRLLLRWCERNTLFLFPSYALLETFLPLAEEAPVPVHAERSGMPQDALMRTVDAFRSRTSALFAVAGGRVAEGLDFPSRELEVVVVVGIPYPKPTAALRALVDYYDWRFQRGWEYAVAAPTSRRLQQCIGRLIRSEEDRGVAIILDRRAVHFKGTLGAVHLAEDPLAVVERHWAPAAAAR